MEQLLLQMKMVLANAFTLYFKAHAAHWNIEGEHFMEYHKYFETLYTDFWGAIDDYAEHIRAIEGLAPGTLGQIIDLSQIGEKPGVRDAMELVQSLAVANDTLLASLERAHELAEEEKKFGLINFLEDRIDYHNKIAWFLRATLAK